MRHRRVSAKEPPSRRQGTRRRVSPSQPSRRPVWPRPPAAWSVRPSTRATRWALWVPSCSRPARVAP